MWVVPKSSDKYPYQRHTEKDRQTRRREGHVRLRLEGQPQANAAQTDAPRGPWGGAQPSDPLELGLWPSEYIAVVFSHQVCGNFLQQQYDSKSTP